MHHCAGCSVGGTLIQRPSLILLRSPPTIAVDNHAVTTIADIDECEENTHNCSQVCQNTIPGFKCACKRGYRMNQNHECVGELANYVLLLKLVA